MSSEIGNYERVNESHYPGRIREASMSRERSDDQRHLAELEEFVKKHKKGSPRQKDTLDLHHQDGEQPQQKETPPDEGPAEESPSQKDDDPPRLDITV